MTGWDTFVSISGSNSNGKDNIESSVGLGIGETLIMAMAFCYGIWQFF